MDRAIAYEEYRNGMKRGFLRLGRKTVKGFALNQYDDTRQGKLCNCVKRGHSCMQRIGPASEGDTKLVRNPFEGCLTVDPCALERQDGSYSSGDEEIIIHSGFDKGRNTALVFDDSRNELAKDKYLHDHVFPEDAGELRGKTAE
jgi:hypothetical protein